MRSQLRIESSFPRIITRTCARGDSRRSGLELALRSCITVNVATALPAATAGFIYNLHGHYRLLYFVHIRVHRRGVRVVQDVSRDVHTRSLRRGFVSGPRE